MKIHFIAIGGAVMHQLAISLHIKGYVVTGSDDEIKDPSKTNLNEQGLLPEMCGWFPEKITEDLDGVILGMHAKADNPELIKAKALNIPIYSFPEYIYEESKNKKRVVIAGSHGKTTTTSMIMHVLKDQNMNFDYLVGAKVEGFDYSVKISEADLMILEGDEYPASVIERRPKIHFYHPHISVITGIAWDHVNVFPTFENYKEQFSIFIQMMNEGATLIYNAQDSEVVKLLENNNEDIRKIPYVTPNYRLNGETTIIPTDEGDLAIWIFGPHNLQNMEAARKVCNELGINNTEFYKSIATFKGAARRLEKITDRKNLITFRDFAHAPSKLKATITAVRSQFPRHYLIGCFELHTYSSLSEKFLSEYTHSMDGCDSKAVFFSNHALTLKGLPSLNIEHIKDYFQDDRLHVFQDNLSLRKWIYDEINVSNTPVCLLLMSSGTFDGMDLDFNVENEIVKED